MHCDSHVHVIGTLAQYPQVPQRTYLASVAPLETLRQLGASRGISRFVIVQPSFYGTDNSAALDAIAALGGNGRGVAVVDVDNAPQPLLDDLARRGIRGLRINLYSPLGNSTPFDVAFAKTARVAKPMNWHVEVIVGIDTIAKHAELLARSEAPVVIDHYAVYGQQRPDSAAARTVLELLRQPHVWIKLSAPYRVGADPLATKPDAEWVKAITSRAAERCVWGSDWPHTPPNEQHPGPDQSPPYRPLSYARLVDDFRAALGSDTLFEQVMSANPARLYGFAD